MERSPEVLPGVKAFPESLVASFDEITNSVPSDFSHRFTNRLILESSPYLQQHAHNPVNWFPWGNEAIELARSSGKPVLISIGYSTCHWCHVMEHESFEDEEIARFLNEHYIAIKVDREERPDVDAVYMAAIHALNGTGGWPLNVWLTPDMKPFWGGTYFPARDGDRGVQMGFLSLLKRIHQAFTDNRRSLEETADQLTEHIKSSLIPGRPADLPTEKSIFQAIDYYKDHYDAYEGGLKRAPKFPSSLPTGLLFRVGAKTGDQQLLDMAETSLRKMAAGGIYDQVAGGFHRYATDDLWLVPHFEKMLYDNALLAVAYLEAYQVTGKSEYSETVAEILDYVVRDMMSPKSLFYSATDADSITPDGRSLEGYYFTWTESELIEALGVEDFELVRSHYNVTSGGNFEGRNILHRRASFEATAEKFEISAEELKDKISQINKKLYDFRNKRDLPFRDEKHLTSWNSLMISAFAKAGFALKKESYLEIAEKAAKAVLEHLSQKCRLLRTNKSSESQIEGFLDDYAYFIAALLDLYEATYKSHWLLKAIKLDNIIAEEFEDKENGGYFMNSASGEKLIAREKPCYDSAIPSGNAVTVMNLMRMAVLTGDDGYRQRYQKAISYFLGSPDIHPVGQAEMLKALDFMLDKPKEIILLIPEDKQQEGEHYLDAIRKRFVPNKVLVVLESEGQSSPLVEVVPIIRSKKAIDGNVTAYICEKGNCHLPVTSLEEFERQIETIVPYPNAN